MVAFGFTKPNGCSDVSEDNAASVTVIMTLRMHNMMHFSLKAFFNLEFSGKRINLKN